MARRPSTLPTERKAACADAEGGCEIEDLFRLLGKARMLDVLYVFHHEAEGPVRFVDLQRRLGASPNTLSERLRELVEAGILSRTAYHEIPPRVDYLLTAKGRDLRTVFQALRAWAGRHNLEPSSPSAATA